MGAESCLDGALTALWPTQTECEVGAGEPPGVPESDLELLRGLRALGATPGPVTPFTRPHYVRRLQEARVARGEFGHLGSPFLTHLCLPVTQFPLSGPDFSRHSPELAEALMTGKIPDAQADEYALTSQFERTDPRRAWRGGVAKASFTYLLLDPRCDPAPDSRGCPWGLRDAVFLQQERSPSLVTLNRVCGFGATPCSAWGELGGLSDWRCRSPHMKGLGCGPIGHHWPGYIYNFLGHTQ